MVEWMGVEDARLVQEWLQSQRSGHQEKDNDTSEDSDETSETASRSPRRTTTPATRVFFPQPPKLPHPAHLLQGALLKKEYESFEKKSWEVLKVNKQKTLVMKASRSPRRLTTPPRRATKPAARMIFPVPPKDPPPLRLLLAPYSTATVKWLGNKVQEALTMKQHKMLEMKLVDKGLISPLQKLDRQAEVGAEGEQKKEPIEQRLVINKQKLEQKLLDIKHQLRCPKLVIKKQPEAPSSSSCSAPSTEDRVDRQVVGKSPHEVNADQKHPLPVPVGPPASLGGS